MSSALQDVRLRKAARDSFSRTPHPYHRRSISLGKKEDSSSSVEAPFSDASRSSDSAEDHAIEADDEKGPLLRLPAPTLRGRKGLKGGIDPSVEYTPVISPVPTPPEEKDGFVFTNIKDAASSGQFKDNKDQRYEKYIKRRRAEIVRRIVETFLLLFIGLLSSLGQMPDTVAVGNPMFIGPGLLKWNYELSCFFAVVCSCYLLYPVRRVLALKYKRLDTSSALRKGFHIPSRFDPGVLLYPVLLPLFIAASIGNHNEVILVNIILGLSSMPMGAIPTSVHGGYYVHWVLSIVPIFSTLPFMRQPSVLKPSPPVAYTTLQEMSLLYPLHSNLVKLISNLVTTSLDPSETQLMSAGLINLLLFALSPQLQILKSLLWVGGLSLFILCEFALKAEVALARIPIWKFARNKISTTGLTGRINRMLKALLPEYRSRFANTFSFDSEDETSPKLHPPRHMRKARNLASQDEDPDSVHEKVFHTDEDRATSCVKADSTHPRPSRSSTFSTFGRAAIMAVKWRNIAVNSNPYLRLTFLHAQALKLFLAAYVYVAATLTILLPVKYFITYRALSGDEAIGWAIGYFVGDIPQLRMFVIGNNLDWWIKLPVNKSQVQFVTKMAWIESYRRQILGSANTRLLLAAYCVLVVAVGIAIVLRLQAVVEVDTRRKVFHGAMVAMLLPTIPVDPCFFALALMIVLAVFLMLDLFRASQLPPISRPLTNFLAPYVDGRDHRGPVIVSHMFLLVGCAIPLWLSLASVRRVGEGPWIGWEVASRDVSMVSGVICVGMGDAAASLVGRRYGKTKWYWGGGKSIEGSAAFACAVMFGLTASWLWLRIGGWVTYQGQELPTVILKSLAAGSGASLMESTLTAANDNVVVPIGLWLLVRGLGL